MGLFNIIMGNASSVDPDELMREYKDLLCDGEFIELAFVVVRDKWVFTNKRLILQNVQGITGKKRDYHSIPYRSVEHFSIETAGTFDDDCEMKIWVRGMQEPIEQNFGRNVNIKDIQRVFASHVL